MKTIIEIRPAGRGWKAFEAIGVEPVFLDRQQAVDYAKCRASFRSGEIQIFDQAGTLAETIQFNDHDRKL